MDRREMLKGWNRAAKKLLARKQPQALRPSSITPQEAAEMAATRQRMNQREKKKLTINTDLIGHEYGWSLVWERLPLFSHTNVPRYDCLCACGEPYEADAHSLLRGIRKHCGCKTKERRRLRAWRKQKRLEKQGRKRARATKFWGMLAA